MGEVKQDVYLAALAGLLHDVGKFAQRAGWQKGEHTEVGGEVVRRYVPAQWREQLYPVMGHHDKPLQGYETKVVALADRLSAGERADERQEQPKQLLSIFFRVKTKDAEGRPQSAPSKLYWPLKPLALEEETLFPGVEWGTAAVQQGYEELWRGFETDLQALWQAHQTGSDLRIYLESLLLLLQHYTWCVPSAYYRSLPDVSLYDHSRMTGALAACLTGKSETTLDQILHAPEQSAEAVALLVGGDISGVQDFIYTISSRGATSGLRGRSFYLQLLTEVAARYVLRRLELPITNLIYQGGGAFYLLARAGDSERLREIQHEISHVLLAHHRGDLYLALRSTQLTAADFYDGRASFKWDELAHLLREAKQHRFGELEQDDLAALFAPQGHGGNEDQQCQVCGQEHPQTEEIKKHPEDESSVRKCPACLSYEALGDALRRARYLWLTEQKSNIPDKPLAVTPGEWRDVLIAFGFQGGVTGDLRQVPDATTRVVLALKDEALPQLHPQAHTVIGRRFLVNVTPTYEAVDADWLNQRSPELQQRLEEDLPDCFGVAVKPFSLLEAQAAGIPRLGILRMDVDNLGTVFAEGLGKAATLSRIAALSLAVGLYFEGWVEHIAEAMNAETYPERGATLYSIYSGGDDLFFVGAWDQVVELARRVRADLTPFAAQHPGIHTSAGIVLVGGKYPLAQAAQDAGDAEKAAKGRADKNALTFLGQTIAWTRFGLDECQAQNLETVHGMAHHLIELISPEEQGEKGGPQALLRLLMRLQEQHDRADQRRRDRGDELNRAGQVQGVYGPWLWRGTYALKRMAERYKEGTRTRQILEDLRNHLRAQEFQSIEWIGLAARWAELLVRK